MPDHATPERDPKRRGNYLTDIREENGQLVADVYAGRELRTVAIDPRPLPDGRYLTATVFLARAPTGTKVWPCSIDLWPNGDGRYTYHHGQTVLNRARYTVVGWNDERYAAHRSRHNSAQRGTSTTAPDPEHDDCHGCYWADEGPDYQAPDPEPEPPAVATCQHCAQPLTTEPLGTLTCRACAEAQAAELMQAPAPLAEAAPAAITVLRYLRATEGRTPRYWQLWSLAAELNSAYSQEVLDQLAARGLAPIGGGCTDDDPPLVQLPGAPVACPWCGRTVRIARKYGTGLRCLCGGALGQEA